MKRPNGAGGIVKLSGKRRNPFVVRVTDGSDSEGKQRVKCLGCFATYIDAENFLVKYRTTPAADLKREDMTLAQVYDEWSSSKFSKISPQMQGNYRAAWRHVEFLARLKICNLRSGQLQEAIDRAARSNGQMLGKSSLEKIRVLFVQLFEYAIKNDIVAKNYAEYLELPKFQKTEKEIFSEIEIERLEQAAASGVPWADVIVMMIYTGFRIDEFLSLTPFSVDLQNMTIIGGMKTEAGRDRIVPIISKILPYVKKWLEKGGDYVICDEHSKKINPGKFRKSYYYPALEAIGVSRLTPHATRHTFASLAFAAGVDPLIVQRIIGHTNYALTANTYTHVDVKQLENELKKLGGK
jgi:integrase